MSMGFVLIHSSEVVYHRLIITWFDKPSYLWYKVWGYKVWIVMFCWGKVSKVRNVLVWGFFEEVRNVFLK
jgi:hypothetical protein